MDVTSWHAETDSQGENIITVQSHPTEHLVLENPLCHIFNDAEAQHCCLVSWLLFSHHAAGSQMAPQISGFSNINLWKQFNLVSMSERNEGKGKQNKSLILCATQHKILLVKLHT